MRVDATTVLGCSPEAAFDRMADARHEPEWNSRVSRAELRSAEPIGLGSEFTIVNSGSPYEVTITTFDRPNRLVFEGAGNPDVTISYAFEPRGEQTEMASTLEFRPNGISKALFAVLAPVIRRSVRKQYTSFKALCES